MSLIHVAFTVVVIHYMEVVLGLDISHEAWRGCLVKVPMQNYFYSYFLLLKDLKGLEERYHV